MKRLNKLATTLVLASALILPSVSQANVNESLFYAARTGQTHAVDNLIKHGANVHYANRSRETAMHAAASTGQLAVIQYLRSKGASHKVPTVTGWFPIHHAVRFGHVHTARYLIQQGSPLHLRTRDGKSVFDIADATRNRTMIQLLAPYRR